jgi:hypothetical protein
MQAKRQPATPQNNALQRGSGLFAFVNKRSLTKSLFRPVSLIHFRRSGANNNALYV